MKNKKCEFCNRPLVISAIDREKERIHLACPIFVAESDEHTCLEMKLTPELEEHYSGKAVLYW